jgi:hypothetical protein
MRHTALIAALIADLVLAALLLTACDASVLEAAPSTVCTEAGVQCQLPTGPLGVCERSQCPADAPSPCFECISQH